MDKLYDQFINALDRFDKEAAVMICLSALDQGQIKVLDLYKNILTPALQRLEFPESRQDEMIWQEHLQSAIVRAVIESAYPYVLLERSRQEQHNELSVIVFCPEEEQHELGARMAADTFTISGFSTTYIGARTPASTLIKALQRLRPQIAVISITNYFNMFAAKRTIELIRKSLDYDIYLVAGGNACSQQSNTCELLDVNKVVRELDDIFEIRREANL